MIYVNQDQLKQVEYLLNQSAQGHHVLFDTDTLRRVFRRATFDPIATPIETNAAYAVEHHIERLMSQPSLAEKRAYLEGLDAETFDQVVKTYFNILENTMYEKLEVSH